MPTRTLQARVATLRDIATTLVLLARYYALVLPQARRQLRRWERRANEIPDATLRDQAVVTLHDEMMNAEAAAVFATLAPSRHRSQLVETLVAFQVMYDYLDTISEQPVRNPLRNGIQLHRALVAALDPAEPPVDYYRHHDRHDDGGYLECLVTTCRAGLEALPAAATVRPAARRAALRCAEGQSHTHAAMLGDDRALVAWSVRQDRAAGYRWWELAAGAISSVAVEALLAAAADDRTTPAEVARIDAAYFPPMCALSTLLDSLVDRESDAVTANHSSFGLYATNEEAAQRLALIAGQAEAGVRRLRHPRRHAAILAGIAGYYLSDEGALAPEARPVAAAIVARLGPMVSVILATTRLHRRMDRRPSEG